MMWEISRPAGGQWPDDELSEPVDPDARRAVADIILRARDKDLAAAALIEAALAGIGNE